jgi:succinate dehydrogenase/fumarate reductase cytochrome b subunit
MTMKIRRLHFLSGLTITLFIALHLFNHLCSVFGAEKHIAIMTGLRGVYRNFIVEGILMVAVLVQILSGFSLLAVRRKTSVTGWEKIRIWTGLYLALFLVVHLGAVFAGRLLLHLDTNFYFAVAGLNTFPMNIFFVPYYALAIISFFGHIAALHGSRMKLVVFGLHPAEQSAIILAIGICLTVVVFYGLTNQFRGVEIPAAYQILIGK